jgi:hypothetical protein
MVEDGSQRWWWIDGAWWSGVAWLGSTKMLFEGSYEEDLVVKIGCDCFES